MPADALELALVGADLTLVILAGAGYILSKRLGPGSVPDVRAAFDLLDRSIVRYAPELPPGYTWKEAFEHLKENGVEGDWKRLEERLSEYEAFRYGKKAAPPGDGADVATVAMKLRRNLVGRGTKGESAGSG